MAEALREDGLTRLGLWGPAAPLLLAVAALVFGLDQTHKWWMLKVFAIEQRGSVALAPFFDLTMAWNEGVSYGLFRTHAQGWLAALALLVSAGLWLWANRSGRLTAMALALVIGGALSNALDRLVHGAVADFFHFHAGRFSWDVFNLADVAIVAGVLLLVYESLIGKANSAAPPNRPN
jgi:signal peptidase II